MSTNCTITIAQISPPVVNVDLSTCPIALTVTPPTSVQVGVTLGSGLPGATGPQGIQGIPGVDGGQDPHLALFLFWDINHPTYFLKYVYIGAVLDRIDMYVDNTMAVKLMSKQFNYTSTVLTQIVITRISDSKTETKDFTYTLGVLTAQQVTQS